MKRFLFALMLAVMATPAPAQVSTYGRLDMIGMPRPEVIDQKPVSAERALSTLPIYVRVRPGEDKHWKRNCAQYKACSVPVYFVRDDWYRRVYEPRYRAGIASDERSDRADRKKPDDDDEDDASPKKGDRTSKPGERGKVRDRP